MNMNSLYTINSNKLEYRLPLWIAYTRVLWAPDSDEIAICQFISDSCNFNAMTKDKLIMVNVLNDVPILGIHIHAYLAYVLL